jgi:hypothetical protein
MPLPLPIPARVAVARELQRGPFAFHSAGAPPRTAPRQRVRNSAFGVTRDAPVDGKHLRENDEMAEKNAQRKVGLAPKLDSGTQLDRVRRICASIPGTVEKISHGEPTFFTPKRVFVMFANNHHGDGHVAVWIPAASGVQAALIEEAPDTYFRPPYVGVGGWVGVELSKVDDEQLGALIREAFRLIASGYSESARPARTARPTQRTRNA